MGIFEVYAVVKGILDTANGLVDFVDRIMNRTQNDPELLGRAERDEGSVVSRALHRLQSGAGTAPRIVLVGETSTGKSALVNALFGTSLADVRLTTDTTDSVLRVQFPSNLVIYDTPGIFGDERLENITRLFIGLKQSYDREKNVKEVPFIPDPDSDVIQVSGKNIREHAPIDIVLWTVNVSRPLTRIMQREVDSFFLELEKKFGKYLVVAGTHLDMLNEVSSEEKQGQLDVWNGVSNNQIIPVSSTTGEGLKDLVTELFKRLPESASLPKLQQSLNQIVKIDRCSFVVTEISRPLAMIMLMSGENREEIEIYVIILITILCNHYSVNEETWMDLHGDGLAIAHEVRKNAGVKRDRVERAPEGLWERIKSWFGATFFRTVERYQSLGVQGLSQILPVFYELIHEFEEIENPALTDESIRQKVLSQKRSLDRLVRTKDAEKLAFRINNLLKSLLQF